MVHMTMLVDERIRELHTIAAELRSARGERGGPNLVRAMRMWAGSALLAAGEALVGGVQPVPARRAVR